VARGKLYHLNYTRLETNILFIFQANVMLEYTLEDAKALLEKNHETAMKNLAQVHHDLDFLR
jgi:hypothetical protein